MGHPLADRPSGFSLGIWAHVAFGTAGPKFEMVQPQMAQRQGLFLHAPSVCTESVQPSFSQLGLSGLD